MCLVLWRSGSKSRGDQQAQPPGSALHQGTSRRSLGGFRQRDGDTEREEWFKTELWCLMCQWGPKHSCAGGSRWEQVLNGMSSRAVPKYAMRSRAKPCCANCTMPCHGTWAGDTLMDPRLASGLGRASQPGRGILPALLARAWHHCLEGSVAVVPGSQGEAEKSPCTLPGSLGNSQVLVCWIVCKRLHSPYYKHYK